MCIVYKQLTKLQNDQFAKDGQIKILRDRYSQVQAELSLQKQKALKAIEQQTEEKSRRETELERDVERLSSEVKFKDHELTELRGILMFYVLYLRVCHLPTAFSSRCPEQLVVCMCLITFKCNDL